MLGCVHNVCVLAFKKRFTSGVLSRGGSHGVARLVLGASQLCLQQGHLSTHLLQLRDGGEL